MSLIFTIVQDVDGRDCQPNAMLGPVLSMLNGLPMGPDITAVVDKVVSALDGCQSANTAAYEVPPHEQLAQLDVFGRTLSAIAQNALAQQNSTSNSTSSSALSSPSPTTVPPNSPNVTSGSAQPTDSSTVQQRDVLFARRGVAAPPQQAVASQTLALVSAPVAAASNVPRALDEGEDCDDE